MSIQHHDIVIACDMDDTIEYLVLAWIQWLNRKHGTNVTYMDVQDWDMKLAFPELTWQEIFEPLALKEFWQDVKPMKDAQYYIQKLIEEGFQFYIVTSSHPNTIAHKVNECLFKHFPYLKWENTIIAKNKQLIRCNVLIDDGEHNIVGPYIGLLKDTMHNRKFNEHAYDNIYRVHCWKHIYETIHKLFDKEPI